MTCSLGKVAKKKKKEKSIFFQVIKGMDPIMPFEILIVWRG